jgi:hypothetical protein
MYGQVLLCMVKFYYVWSSFIMYGQVFIMCGQVLLRVSHIYYGCHIFIIGVTNLL